MNKIISNLLLAFGIGLLVLISVMLYRFDADILPQAVPKKVGFITLGDVNMAGWNGSHYQGIKTACDNLGVRLVYLDKVAENTGDCPIAIEKLAAEDVGMIFLNSYGYPAEVCDLVKSDYEHIAFATNSGEAHARNLTAYFVRLYQGRYLAGVLAGMRTKTNVIGYVAAIPNCEVCRGINAFTLGVQRVNPAAKVVVAWTNEWENPPREKELAVKLVRDAGADLLTYHQDEKAVADTAELLGVDFIGYNELLTGYSAHCLTSVVCRWDIFYDDILRRYLKGELNSLRNNWIGVERDAIGLSPYSDRVTPEMRQKLAEVRQELIDGQELIFVGELYDINGKLRCQRDESISDDALLESVNWLVRGVSMLDGV